MRRSVRDFSDQPLSDELLEEILGEASLAPTAGNLQSYSVICTRNRDQLALLSSIHSGQSFIARAGALLTFCVDVRRTRTWLQAAGLESGFENLWGFLVASGDCWSAAQSTVTASEKRGLGTCHSGATFAKALDLIEFFGCPSGVLPVASLALGYPREGATLTARAKLPLTALIHHERYRDDSQDGILQLFKQRETSEMGIYRELYGETLEPTLAALYAKRKYPREQTDLSSIQFFRALARQGFIGVA